MFRPPEGHKFFPRDEIAATSWVECADKLLKRIVGVNYCLHVRPLASCVTRSDLLIQSSKTFGTAIASGSAKKLGVPRTMKPSSSCPKALLN